MSEPPVILDSSQVVMFAILDGSVTYTGGACVVVDGIVIDPVQCLAICRSFYDDDVLLFRCDSDWNVLGAGLYGSVEKAQASADAAYAGVARKWQAFRVLTPEDMAKVDETRRRVRNSISSD